LPTRSLTQTEAQRRAALLSVDRYDIDVDLTDLPTGPRVRSVSTVTFTCREPGAETFIDCAAEVVSAVLNDRPLAPAVDGRIVLDGLAAQNVLRVESVQDNTVDGEGVHRAVDPADDEVYVWMSFEPDEARHVWACFDQPDLKAPHAFTVTAPAGWTVTSNSGDPRIEELGEARRWTFPDTPALSSYNTVINAGPLYEIRREVDGYDLGVFARRSLAAILDRDADEIFLLTGQGLGFYGRVFGMPFPQRKYDQVFMPEFGGAMENYGCVTWSDSFLRRSAPTPAEKALLARVLLHEMAHMWFGNIVTMRWWDDLWLNEAFAEFACHWAAVSATSHTDAWAAHLAGEKLTAYVADQGPISHPISLPIRDVAEAASIFDAITYPKGASVLQQLMTYVGEENFVTGMTAYFARHAWGNTTLQDLVDALGTAGDRDLNAWRTGWLETAGTDRLTLEHNGDGDGAVLVARGPDGPPRPQVAGVGAYRWEGDRLVRTALVRVEVQGPRTPVELPAGADFVLVNDDDLTFATIRPTGGDVAGLLAAAPALPTAVSRGVAVATIWDMLITGELTAHAAAQGVLSVLRVETSDAVIEPYLTMVGNIANLWSPDAERPAIEAAVAAVCRELAGQESRRQVALRAFARVAGDLAEVAWLQEQAADDVDLHWRALGRKAELGGDTDDEVAALLDRDPDPDARPRAFAVRAARPDASEKAAVWEALTVERSVPLAAIAPVAGAFWRPGQDELLAPYAERYLDLLPGLDRGGMIPAMRYTGLLLPLFGVDESFLDRAEKVAEKTAPVVRKTLRERSDLVRRILRSRANGS
jgi:aminopeptidase N